MKDGQYENTKRIIEGQNKFNETGDPKYLYDILPDLRHAVQSVIWKRLKGNPTRTYKENAQMIAEKWALDMIKRRKKGKPYEMSSPICYAYFMYRRYNPTDDSIINNIVDDEDNVMIELQSKDYAEVIDYDPYNVDYEFLEENDEILEACS